MIREEIKELKLLYEINQKLGALDDLEGGLEAVLGLLARDMGTSRGMITILSPGTGEIKIEVAHGLSERQRRRGRYRIGEGVTGQVVETGQPALIPRIDEEPLFLDKTRSRKDLDRKAISFICVPIRHHKETIGTISVDRIFGTEVSLQEDLRLLSVIAALIGESVHRRREAVEEQERLVSENIRLHAELEGRAELGSIIGKTHQMQEVYRLVHQVAQSDATVLVRGESGTGKELVARAIHYSSPRQEKPFIKVNCAALPQGLIESELFGHVKGAFTGALADRKGRFELAEGGTLLLDEIGDIDPSTQVKLLRVLQEREFERVGSDVVRRADTRIIATTNADLEGAIAARRFREDLYYRLNVFPIYLPPLRDRKADIISLADHFLEKYANRHGRPVRRISTPAIDIMMEYHWPGNVRELENAIERAVLLSQDGVVRAYHLPPSLQTAHSSDTSKQGTLKELVGGYEKEIIVETLKRVRGNQTQAAKELGTTARILGYKIRSYDIDPKLYRSERSRPVEVE